MKKVKLNLFVLLASLALFTTACYKDDISADGDFGDEWYDEDGGYSDDEYDEGGSSNGLAILTTYAINGETITKIKDHNIAGNMESFQQNTAKHQEMWEYFKKLIPTKNRVNITEFIVFHGQNELLGYVEPIDYNDLSKWRMGLAIDQAGDIGEIDIKTEFAYTAIHEFGHVLTLNNTQLAVGGSDNTCSSYHTGEGCSEENSYINAIYELGWKDIYQEFVSLGEDGYELYNKYTDRFVTEYAATNPAEDAAEVFTVFVTQESMPSGNTIADRKVRLMYDYPELVDLREEIRKDPFARAIIPGSWVKHGKRHNCMRKGHKAHSQAN